MATLLILFVSSGLLLAGLSVPLLLRKVAPNPLYGFRVKRTLEDPTVWYAVNFYAAKRLLVLGLTSGLIAVVLFVVPGISFVTYALVNGLIVLAGLLIAVIQSFAYLRSFSGSPEVRDNQR